MTISIGHEKKDCNIVTLTPFIICVCKEKVVIHEDKHFVSLSGDSAIPPTVSGNDTASTTCTTSIKVPRFMTIYYFVMLLYNTLFHFLPNSALAPKSRAEKGQAVYVRVFGDKTVFYHCVGGFVGYQNAFEYFTQDAIQNVIDFICGNSRSLYEDCHLNFIGESKSWITAQNRDKESNKTGFSLIGGHITGPGHGTVHLRRPWGQFSTQMDEGVAPQGWDSFWSNEDQSKTIYYAEYASWGLGANNTDRVPWDHKLKPKQIHSEENTTLMDPHGSFDCIFFILFHCYISFLFDTT
ncbi:hypothetical protein AMTRI_Chr04g180550 [Amborella trichopoda]